VQVLASRQLGEPLPQLERDAGLTHVGGQVRHCAQESRDRVGDARGDGTRHLAGAVDPQRATLRRADDAQGQPVDRQPGSSPMTQSREQHRRLVNLLQVGGHDAVQLPHPPVREAGDECLPDQVAGDEDVAALLEGQTVGPQPGQQPLHRGREEI